jgi:putative exosortase-associated protein (TIGR04073 family)
MLKTLSLLGVVACVALLSTGCAGPEKKLGRGMNNLGEIVRWGDMRRSVEQNAVFRGSNAGTGQGFVAGFNKSLTRIGVGIYEIATFPLPSYDPVLTHYISPAPGYPDSFRPGLADDPMYATDTALGFSGGEIAPFVPGSRFAVFRTP